MADDQPSREALLAALDKVRDPFSGQGLAAAGMAQSLTIDGAKVFLALETPAERAAAYAPVREAAERALGKVRGVASARVMLTADASAAPAQVRRRAQAAADPRADPSSMPPAEPLANVARVIAVASGKGGVGKSTVASNLACAFAALGLRAGLLDADIHGPSAARMFGITDKPEFSEGKIQPAEAFGVQVMSMGMIVPEAQAMIWRGPMASSAVRQLINDVAWGANGPLDVLVVDLPPGTGDIHLTLVQRLKIDGAVIVSTPQEVALIDARRAAAMFGKVNPPVPILGVVENMAYFPDPSTGAPLEIFGRGGARAEADRLGVPFLGEVPIDMALRIGGDEGRPLVATHPDGETARVFLEMARTLG
ncbi:MAG TPA: Mrp/NBP35 family ATP-binding protein [Caulobacteraceae bacterium]|jgi:ATP-binding protein involved in chromosome partitioning|nr:Mrp/NBP35 family ATP-binding protein [Caulobacteraceae bacterium]